MFTKAAIIIAFFNSFIWGQIHQIDADITQKTSQMQGLSAVVKEAEKSVGLAETMEYVEKIGLIDQLKDQIADLEKQKTSLETQVKTP